jgi:hypothetical protein
MTPKEGFSFHRLILLIRNDLYLNRSYLLISSAAILGGLFFFSTFHIYTYTQLQHLALPKDFYMTAYPIYSFICGALLTVKIFNEINHEVKGPVWLNLPASIPEKFMSRFLLTTLLFIAWILVLVALASLISEGLNILIFGQRHAIFNPFREEVLVKTFQYFLGQSLFLFGAIFFKKHALPKTVLSLVVYNILLNIFISAGGKIFFEESFTELNITGTSSILTHIITNNSMLPPDWNIEKTFYSAVFYWIITIGCWVASYFRLKETEA